MTWKSEDLQSSIFAVRLGNRGQFNESASYSVCFVTRVLACYARLYHRCRIVKVAVTWKSWDPEIRVVSLLAGSPKNCKQHFGGMTGRQKFRKGLALNRPPREDPSVGP